LRVIGIDPGSQITGIGIVDVANSSSSTNDVKYVHAESLRLPKGDLAKRLAVIFQRLEILITEYKPSVMALEKVFLSKNPQSALVLGHARGAAMLAGVNAGLDIAEYSATEIKKTIVGKGRADKAQVQHMVRVLLSLRVTPEEDAADALAGAICHIYQSAAEERLGVSKANLASRMKYQ